MFELYVDFDEIRERLVDYVFAGAGFVSDALISVIDAVEEATTDE